MLRGKNDVGGDAKTPAKTPAKPRGKKGKMATLMMKPEEVIDFMIRNYPSMNIELIRESVLDSLRNREDNEERLNVLEEITIDDEQYYYDGRGNIINCDTNMCGFVIGLMSDYSGSLNSSDGTLDGEDRDDEECERPPKTYKIGTTIDKTVKVQMFKDDRDIRTLKQVINDIEIK